MSWWEHGSWILLSLTFSLLLALHGLRKKSLAPSGAVAAFVVGAVCMLSGFRFGVTLIAFYLSSSKLTKFKAEVKRNLEEDFKEGGQRDWLQVLANSTTAIALCTAFAIDTGWRDECLDTGASRARTALLSAFVGHFAACNGDTWASELGILSPGPVRLITTFQAVRRGTNGGVTWLGTATSGAGGAFIGLCFFLLGPFTVSGCAPSAAARQWRLIPLGLAGGLFGSALDSLLGATLQFSGLCSRRKVVVSRPGPGVTPISGHDLLSNSTVNFIASFCTACALALASAYIF